MNRPSLEEPKNEPPITRLLRVVVVEEIKGNDLCPWCGQDLDPDGWGDSHGYCDDCEPGLCGEEDFDFGPALQFVQVDALPWQASTREPWRLRSEDRTQLSMLPRLVRRPGNE